MGTSELQPPVSQDTGDTWTRTQGGGGEFSGAEPSTCGVWANSGRGSERSSRAGRPLGLEKAGVTDVVSVRREGPPTAWLPSRSECGRRRASQCVCPAVPCRPWAGGLPAIARVWGTARLMDACGPPVSPAFSSDPSSGLFPRASWARLTSASLHPPDENERALAKVRCQSARDSSSRGLRATQPAPAPGQERAGHPSPEGQKHRPAALGANEASCRGHRLARAE